MPVQRNPDPLMHPLSRARERKRALNASKIERMFSKPFIASFEGHEDAVECLERVRGRVGAVVSAGFDGSTSAFLDSSQTIDGVYHLVGRTQY
jgi:DDB1- and CUL4-associated factor 13